MVFPKTYNLKVISAILSLGGVLQGLETVSLMIALHTPEPSLTKLLTIGASRLGAIVGCLMAGSVYDHLGIVWCQELAALLWITGGFLPILQAWVYIRMVACVAKGAAMGVCSVGLLCYACDTMPTKRRGRALALVQLTGSWGAFQMYLMGYACSYLVGETAGTVSEGLEVIPGILLMLTAIALPPSPRWLARHAKWITASKVAHRLEGPVQSPAKKLAHNPLSASSPGLSLTSVNRGAAELEKILHTMVVNEQRTYHYWSLLSRRLQWHTLLASTAQIMTQATGHATLTLFLLVGCDVCGVAEEHRVMVIGFQFMASAVGSGIPVLFLDGARRKSVLVFGTFTLFLGQTLLGTVMALYGQAVEDSRMLPFVLSGPPASAALALWVFLLAVIASTVTATAWLYTGEIVPAKARAKGVALSMALSWAFLGLLLLVTPWMLTTLSYGTFYLYGAMCLFACIVCAWRFPETKNLSEQAVNVMYGFHSYRDYAPKGTSIGGGGGKPSLEGAKESRESLLYGLNPPSQLSYDTGRCLGLGSGEPFKPSPSVSHPSLLKQASLNRAVQAGLLADSSSSSSTAARGMFKPPHAVAPSEHLLEESHLTGTSSPSFLSGYLANPSSNFVI